MDGLIDGRLDGLMNGYFMDGLAEMIRLVDGRLATFQSKLRNVQQKKTGVLSFLYLSCNCISY